MKRGYNIADQNVCKKCFRAASAGHGTLKYSEPKFQPAEIPLWLN